MGGLGLVGCPTHLGYQGRSRPLQCTNHITLVNSLITGAHQPGPLITPFRDFDDSPGSPLQWRSSVPVTDLIQGGLTGPKWRQCVCVYLSITEWTHEWVRGWICEWVGVGVIEWAREWGVRQWVSEMNEWVKTPKHWNGCQKSTPGTPFLTTGPPFLDPGFPFLDPGFPFSDPGLPFLDPGLLFLDLGPEMKKLQNTKTLKGLPKIDLRDPVLNHRAPVLRSRVPVLRSRAPVLRSRVPVLRFRPRNEKAAKH